ncbi:MAG: dehydrogenase [Candidatus Handelsmanbacteria bacterium RIFCSPLOWO2_12_FULL_64_10]|uniref:Dehydrogenase n=1 Tax=Handelsmanbacteria sp. (strain RIFCSPLOWO2_12_FULL_64_10) TaxID=1817868 RepID=A0A1F6D4N0_HANXR|nr:MAG: dehydrogenase [Candidatus Handelsmanbacteria bacterium RIFCSPLOWO2_12_FULL_64_10]
MSQTFRVGVTRDFLRPDGTLGFGDIGLSLLDNAPGVVYEFLAENTPELRADQVKDYDALLVLAPRVTAATIEGADRLTVVARFGVGYDNVDVEACARRGVLITITPDGVRRPVAVAVLTLVLALSHKLLIKDRLTRAGRWAEKLDHMGMGVTGRTLGVIGLGNIGREVFALARPFGMRHLACDPYATSAEAGAELVDLKTLLGASDFVCICCALTPETHHLINAERLALMKPTAYLINAARGPILDQQALTAALRERRIQGAGLDVFEQEPIDPGDPILTLDNVIVAPHAICWTDECFLGNGRSACESILDVAAGRVPRHVVNRAALDHPRLKERLRQ